MHVGLGWLLAVSYRDPPGPNVQKPWERGALRSKAAAPHSWLSQSSVTPWFVCFFPQMLLESSFNKKSTCKKQILPSPLALTLSKTCHRHHVKSSGCLSLPALLCPVSTSQYCASATPILSLSPSSSSGRLCLSGQHNYQMVWLQSE